jgi:hypothetical protein
MVTGASSLFSFFYALVVLVLIDLDYTSASANSPFPEIWHFEVSVDGALSPGKQRGP